MIRLQGTTPATLKPIIDHSATERRSMATLDKGSAFMTKFDEREGEGLCLNIWLSFKASLSTEVTARPYPTRYVVL